MPRVEDTEAITKDCRGRLWSYTTGIASYYTTNAALRQGHKHTLTTTNYYYDMKDRSGQTMHSITKNCSTRPPAFINTAPTLPPPPLPPPPPPPPPPHALPATPRRPNYISAAALSGHPRRAVPAYKLPSPKGISNNIILTMLASAECAPRAT